MIIYFHVNIISCHSCNWNIVFIHNFCKIIGMLIILQVRLNYSYMDKFSHMFISRRI